MIINQISFRPKSTVIAGTLAFLSAALLNIRTSHNWGGDFSMYIHQAKNLVEGLSQMQNGYLYSTYTSYHGPQSYPVGFPLLLAPFYALFGNSIYHFQWAMSAIVFAFSLLNWRYLTLVSGNIFTGFVLATLISFNPWVIDFKGNILSDLPFACMAVGVILLMHVPVISWRRVIAVGILSGYALLTRSAGVAILGGFILFSLRCVLNRGKLNIFSFQKTGTAIGISVSIFLLFQYVLFPAPSINSYSDSFDAWAMLRMISKNADYYLRTLRDMIPNAGPVIYQTVFYHFIVVGIMVGFILKMKRTFNFTECFVLSYLALILIWPGLQGYRLLLPLTTVGLGYAYVALREVFSKATSKNLTLIHWVVLGTALLAFAHPAISVHKKRGEVVDGPQLPEASEMFDYIRMVLPKEAVITFHNPRVLGLYGERNSVADPYDAEIAQIRTHFKKMGANFHLVDRQLSPVSIQTFVSTLGDPLHKNSRFFLYRSDFP